MTISAAPVLLGIGTYAAALGVTRDVLRRILSEAGVQPAGKKAGHPAYALGDVVTAWVNNQTGGGPDPDSLRPIERKAHYQAEHEKLRLQVERGELVPAIEVEQGQASIFKIVTHALETLPDVLERDVGLSAVALEKVESQLDRLREALYQRLAEDADSSAEDRAQRP